MKLEIRELKKKDYKKAVRFAIKGMHLNWYTDRKILLELYGRYFWYLELTRATQIIAVYAGKELAGVLLAEIRHEKRQYVSLWKTLYVKGFDYLQNHLAEGVNLYNKANREMFLHYCKENRPDGEITFLAANPGIKVKGIGSLLLEELERRAQGKRIYLYTDSACTYQFYEHRGFERVGEKNIILDIMDKTVPLKCMLFSKVIPSHSKS